MAYDHKGEKHWNFGNKLSQSTKDKISSSLKGKTKLTDEERVRRVKERKHNIYLKNKDAAINSANNTRKRRVEWFNNYKSKHPCSICDENDPVCIDFHHKEGTEKELPIASMITRGYPLKRIEEELKKCVPVCSNCHRKIHRNDQGKHKGVKKCVEV